MNKLFEYLKKPELFALSSDKFWDDEHISKGMLDAHLNPTLDAATRNHRFVAESVDWICKCYPAKDYQKILDLGCGPGIYANLLNEKGYHITGIDYSKRSIEYAKAHNKNNEYIYKNYLDIDYENEFDLVLLIYCDYGALTDDERKVIIRNVYKALRKGGYFIFDVNTPNLYKDVTEGKAWRLVNGSGFWKNTPHLILEANYIYKPNIYLDQYVIVDEMNKTNVFRIWDKVYTKSSIQEDLKLYQFRKISYFNDVKGSEYSDDAKTMCVVLRK